MGDDGVFELVDSGVLGTGVGVEGAGVPGVELGASCDTGAEGDSPAPGGFCAAATAGMKSAAANAGRPSTWKADGTLDFALGRRPGVLCSCAIFNRTIDMTHLSPLALQFSAHGGYGAPNGHTSATHRAHENARHRTGATENASTTTLSVLGHTDHGRRVRLRSNQLKTPCSDSPASCRAVRNGSGRSRCRTAPVFTGHSFKIGQR
jgi:hypothetical protein